jgi:Ku protein
MPRVIWKGAISFGLVHIPVAVYPASSEDDIDFDWLDKRSMDPVGYQRINKRTGKVIDKDNIVKGIKYEEGQYVILSDDEIKDAYPRTTQTIEIEAFVRAQEIPFVHLERPYYLAPINKGEKVYALLRETLIAQERVGVARVDRKVKAGDVKQTQPLEAADQGGAGGNVIDLTELLKRSLGKRPTKSAAPEAPAAAKKACKR